MPQTVSLTSRRITNAPATDGLQIVLLHITHPNLINPIRLTTDPTDRIPGDELAYGTYSTWKTTDGTPFLFAATRVTLPDDARGVVPSATITLDNVSNTIAELLLSIQGRAIVDMAVVTAGAPDVLEGEFEGFELMEAAGDGAQYALTISQDNIFEAPFPIMRMTKDRFPGLFG